jgi:hypothetical protein
MELMFQIGNRRGQGGEGGVADMERWGDIGGRAPTRGAPTGCTIDVGKNGVGTGLVSARKWEFANDWARTRSTGEPKGAPLPDIQCMWG